MMRISHRQPTSGITVLWFRNALICMICLGLYTPVCAQGTSTTGSSDIIVTGSIYRGDVASGGARIDAEVRDLPLSISVVTNALINDRQIRTLRQLADNVAGVESRVSGSGGFAVDFTVRGLRISSASTSVNGFRIDSFATGFDPQAVERLEFLKGPASVLYGGAGSLSGLVNIVTKTPLPENFILVDATGGTREYGRIGMDANTRLSDTLDGRLNIALTHEHYPNAFRTLTEQFANPVVQWHPSPKVSVLVEASYFHSLQPSYWALSYPSITRFLDLPKTFKVAEKWDRQENTAINGRIDAVWTIASGLSLRQGINYQRYNDDAVQQLYPYGRNLFNAPDLLERDASSYALKVRYLTSQSEVRWSFFTGAFKHSILLGYEHSHESFNVPQSDIVALPPLSLINPVYEASQPFLPETNYQSQITRSDGIYLQDFVQWKRLKLLLGGRFDKTFSSAGFCSYTTPGCIRHEPSAINAVVGRDTAFSPRLGLVWDPNDGTVVYVSYSKSFNPSASQDRNNKPLPPERGTQYEIGLRKDLLSSHRLSLSMAVFRLTRSNIPFCDPLFPDCMRYVAIGAQRVSGFEAELSGKPLDWIDILATYDHQIGKVLNNDEAITGIPNGSRLPEAVKDAASLFTKVALVPIGMPKLSLSAGVYYLGPRPGRNYLVSFFAGPNATPFRINPASTRIDLGAYWDVTAKVRVQANITNLFDTYIIEPGNLGFSRATPFSASLGVRLSL